LAEVEHDHKKLLPKSKKQAPRPTDNKAAREATLLFEKQERRRESQRRRDEAAEEERRERRQQAMSNAQAALERSGSEHQGNGGDRAPARSFGATIGSGSRALGERAA
jgi:hypothetical protein